MGLGLGLERAPPLLQLGVADPSAHRDHHRLGGGACEHRLARLVVLVRVRVRARVGVRVGVGVSLARLVVLR